MKTAQQNVEDICETYGVTPAELLGDSRTPHLVRARWVLCWVWRKRGMSYPEIGRQLGREHSTIFRNLRKMPVEIDSQELEDAWRVAITGAEKSASVAREIIDINTLLQGTIAAEAMDSKTGAIVAMALNRLQALAADAERVLRSGDEAQGA